jgi:hypothetical protein
MPAVGDIVELVVKGVCNAQEIINVLHFVRGTSDATLADLISHLETDSEFQAGLINFCCNDYTLQLWQATEITPGTPGVLHTTPPGDDTRGAQLVVPASGTVVGTSGTAGYLGAAGVVTKYTGVAGRAHRGRNYFGPASGAAVVDGSWIADVHSLTGLEAIATELGWFTPDGAGDGDWFLAVYSFFYKFATIVTSLQAHALARSQRRRNIGIGR